MPNQFFFGAGALYGKLNVISPAVPTPVKFGTLQDVNVEFSFDVKELYGVNQFPDHIGRGKAKITGKAKLGQLHGAMFNSLFFGQTLAVSELLGIQGEAGTIPVTVALEHGADGVVAYTITAKNTVFAQDLGVVYAASAANILSGLAGVPFTRVAPASEAAGKYSVNETTGVYTFSSADNGLDVLIDYLYTSAATGGSIAIANEPMGLAPTFETVLTGITDGKTMTLVLNECISSKLTLPTKNEDHVVVEFDFAAMADQYGNVGTLTVTE